MTDRRRVAAGLAIDLLLVGVLGWTGPRPAVLRAALTDPQGWLDRVGPDAAVITAAGLLCWLVLLWVTVGVLLVLGAGLPGVVGRAAEAVAGRVIPAAVRRATLAALGVSLGTAMVAGTAAADTSPPTIPQATATVATDRKVDPPPREDSPARSHGVDWPLEPAPAEPPTGLGSPVASRAEAPSPAGTPARTASSTPRVSGPATSGEPTRTGPRPLGPDVLPRPGGGSTPPTTAAGAGRRTTAQPYPAPDGTTAAPQSVVVRPGDSLWLIAARRLGAQASIAEVARAWPRWYAANRGAIGDDPDVIHPGQALVVPPDRPAEAGAAAQPRHIHPGLVER